MHISTQSRGAYDASFAMESCHIDYRHGALFTAKAISGHILTDGAQELFLLAADAAAYQDALGSQ